MYHYVTKACCYETVSFNAISGHVSTTFYVLFQLLFSFSPPPPTHLTIHFSLYSNWYKSTKLESQQSLRSLYIISLHKTQRIILSTYFCNQPEEIAGSGLDALFECLFAFQISFQLSL